MPLEDALKALVEEHGFWACKEAFIRLIIEEAEASDLPLRDFLVDSKAWLATEREISRLRHENADLKRQLRRGYRDADAA
jgi:hypothetical protein